MNRWKAFQRFTALGAELRVKSEVQPRIERRYIELPVREAPKRKRFALAWVASYLDSAPREIAIDDKTGEVLRDRS